MQVWSFAAVSPWRPTRNMVNGIVNDPPAKETELCPSKSQIRAISFPYFHIHQLKRIPLLPLIARHAGSDISVGARAVSTTIGKSSWFLQSLQTFTGRYC